MSEKIEWIRQQLYEIRDYINRNPDETLGESGLDGDLWRVINGYSVYGDEKINLDEEN